MKRLFLACAVLLLGLLPVKANILEDFINMAGETVAAGPKKELERGFGFTEQKNQLVITYDTSWGEIAAFNTPYLYSKNPLYACAYLNQMNEDDSCDEKDVSLVLVNPKNIFTYTTYYNMKPLGYISEKYIKDELLKEMTDVIIKEIIDTAKKNDFLDLRLEIEPTLAKNVHGTPYVWSALKQTIGMKEAVVWEVSFIYLTKDGVIHATYNTIGNMSHDDLEKVVYEISNQVLVKDDLKYENVSFFSFASKPKADEFLGWIEE